MYQVLNWTRGVIVGTCESENEAREQVLKCARSSPTETYQIAKVITQNEQQRVWVEVK